jgi:hypothetical protein
MIPSKSTDIVASMIGMETAMHIIVNFPSPAFSRLPWRAG